MSIRNLAQSRRWTFKHSSYWEGNGNPLQYSCLENPMDGGPWWAAVCGVARSRTWLSDFTFTFHFHALEEEMTTHSSVLAWRIPRTGEPGGLLSMASHRVRHDWSNLAAEVAAIVDLVFLYTVDSWTTWGFGVRTPSWSQKLTYNFWLKLNY